MGNSCGCVDPAEKDAEVNIDKQQTKNKRNADPNDVYGTIGKGYEMPQLFDTEDTYLIELQKNAVAQGLQFVEELSFDNGAVYKGYLLSDQRHGPGVQVWLDNAKYEGEWRENKANGRGKRTSADGDIYDGEWEDDKASGYGIYIHVDGAQYKGYWKNDLQDGHGLETW